MATSTEEIAVPNQNPIGQRIARYRKFVGIKTAKELAERIDNPKITVTVIQNIESGRKAELSVSQLLDISRGLGISPIFLLAPIGKPFEDVDIPEVGQSIAKMKVHEFESWISCTGEVGLEESEESIVLRRVLESIRNLFEAVEQVKKAAMNPDLIAEDQVGVVDGEPYNYSPSSWAQQLLEDAQNRVDKLYNFLSRYTVDLDWVERPWVNESQ